MCSRYDCPPYDELPAPKPAPYGPSVVARAAPRRFNAEQLDLSSAGLEAPAVVAQAVAGAPMPARWELPGIAAGVVIPFDRGEAAHAHVAELRGRWRCYFAVDGGRGAEWFGPAFDLDAHGGALARELAKLVEARRLEAVR